MLLQFYRQLLKHDPSYHLYIRGVFQDERLKMATMTMIDELRLKDKIEFVDWVDDLNSWFADKSHILSFSLEESFHYAIGEGMAAGLKPSSMPGMKAGIYGQMNLSLKTLTNF